MSNLKSQCVTVTGAFAALGLSLGVAPAAASAAQPGQVETNQAKVESNQWKHRVEPKPAKPAGGLFGRLKRAAEGVQGAVNAVSNPSGGNIVGAIGTIGSSSAASPASGGAAGAGLASLKLDAGAMSIAEGGILRCESGQDLQFGLIGEDSSMERVPLEPHSPKAHSTNGAVVQAAMSSNSSYVVNVRCGGDGEAWVVADAGGQRAVYPVLVGRARKQAAMTTKAP